MIAPMVMYMILRRRSLARHQAAARRRATARRFTILIQAIVACALQDSVNTNTRNLQAFPRSSAWARFMLSAFACAADFRAVFQMNRPQFVQLCAVLDPHLRRQRTRLREPIPIAVRVAIFLVFAGSGASFSVLGAQFGVGLSTVSAIIHEVGKVIRQQLHTYVRFPRRPHEMMAAAIRFEDSHGVPGCIGAMDGCHIPIRQPAVKKSAKFYNRKGFYSLVLSAVVDTERRFIDIDIRWPGSVGDSRVFYNSPIGELAARDWDLQNDSLACSVQIG